MEFAGDLTQTLSQYDSVTDFEIHSISERDVSGMSVRRKRVKFAGNKRYVKLPHNLS